MVTTIITAMAAYSNERVAAIVISVLYRMLTILCKRCGRSYKKSASINDALFSMIDLPY